MLIPLIGMLIFPSCKKSDSRSYRFTKPPIEEPVVSTPVNEKQYKGNLSIIIGDVKQAFIQDKITNASQLDFLLKGFIEGFKVDGIRIPIFPEGYLTTSQESLLAHLVVKARENKLKIFANPANHAGAQRIANGDMETIGGVKGDTAKTNKLMQAIKNFSIKYKCDFICPFNEDGQPGTPWEADQINTIFSGLKGKLNGAALVGPCAWGIPAAINTLDQTNIEEFISVATTHNLGFNHDKWPEFIQKSGSLPVWDSEVNMHEKYENKVHRTEAAISAGVNGLVLYDSWKMINMNTGEVNSSGKEWVALYLK